MTTKKRSAPGQGGARGSGTGAKKGGARESGTAARKGDARESESVAKKIDRHIRDLGGWKGPVLERMRALIHEADPEVVEEWKWQKATSPGVPVWSHDGGICTGETYREVVKLTFHHGASLEDPAGLFNASLGGSMRRAIDIREGEKIDAAVFKRLVRAAVAFNGAKRK